MEIIYVLVGAVLGGLAGFFIGKGGSKVVGGTDEAVALRQQLTDTQVELAGAQASASAYKSQIQQMEQARLAKEAKEREDSALLQSIAPMREKLAEMQTAVTNMETQRAEQVATLNASIRQSLESDEYLRRQTEQLSKALSSNSVRGLWGETQLRKLVELAGLLKHADFDEQATITAGRADMIINLPGGKQLAIDSKVPFNSYQEAAKISELAEGAEKAHREALMKEHVKAVRKHIDDLAGRAYWAALDVSPDFVVCFIPSEALLAASLEADASLLEYAFGKNVALASPVSLFSVLKTINYIWRQNVDETQVRAMIALGHELYQRVGIIADLADKLGNSIKSSVKAYNSFVSSFESRFLVTARKLNDLDANQLSTDVIEAPKVVEEAPKQITAAEALGAKQGELDE